ncbi:hypothetical protein [Streptomyces sp. MP131-18]|uniref:hypothetical protein n=1 Tax=Streptomyces sp. MP131-18 TaxID=1857892 RepID=UPI00097C38AD|nr:hypothetical protein [Streptomyces sp. MP131-18]ONK09511.1 hypothetical protein STBA_02110 [Streptomyces sp. MP131-18]
MGEWGIALIAAGAALAGSLITGWFSRAAGSRQAEAARHAGDRQADALLETVRMTLREQRDARVQDVRRQTYVRFLEAAEGAILARRTGDGQASARADLQQALGAVDLEGPDAVAGAARGFLNGLRANEALGDLGRAREAFVDAARSALHI